MSVQVYQDQGAAKLNEAVEVGRLKSIGPVELVMSSLSSEGEAIVFAEDGDGAHISNDDETAVADEDTLYDGDTATLVFTGEVLNNLPVIPGTLTVQPTAGGDSVDATDRDGDGNLYTSDVDEDFCGTVDYFTGALELSYPTGKAPNTTNILADYTYGSSTIKPLGKKNFTIPNVGRDTEVVVKSASNLSTGTSIRMEGVSTWQT